jgi:hypothetical protein
MPGYKDFNFKPPSLASLGAYGGASLRTRNKKNIPFEIILSSEVQIWECNKLNKMKRPIFWDITLCSLWKVNRRFWGT